MDSEEQQALKSITKYAQIIVDLSHEEQLCFYAQIENTGVPGFPDMVVNYSVEVFFFYFNIVILSFLFTAVIPWRETEIGQRV